MGYHRQGTMDAYSATLASIEWAHDDWQAIRAWARTWTTERPRVFQRDSCWTS